MDLRRYICRCREGDEAVIEHSEFPANVGLRVLVVRPKLVPLGCSPEWVVRLVDQTAQASIGTPFGDTEANASAEHFIEDWRLKPVPRTEARDARHA